VPRKSQIPPYRLHHRSGQAVVHVNGRDVYHGVHDTPKSKAKYHEIIRKVHVERSKAEMERGALLYTDVKIAKLAAKYLPYAKSYYTKHGVATSQTAIAKLATDVALAKFSHLEGRKFGPVALLECQHEFVTRGLGRNEVNRRIRLIRRMFKWAVAMQMVEPSVLHGPQALDGLRRGHTTAPDKKPVRPVHSSQIDAIMPYVAPAVGAMVRLQELTGMRPNEVVQMRGCDLNMSGNIWWYRPEHHKFGAPGCRAGDTAWTEGARNPEAMAQARTRRIPFLPSADDGPDPGRGQLMLDGTPKESKASGDEIRSVKRRRCRIGRSAEAPGPVDPPPDRDQDPEAAEISSTT
jgi:integrase